MIKHARTNFTRQEMVNGTERVFRLERGVTMELGSAFATDMDHIFGEGWRWEHMLHRAFFVLMAAEFILSERKRKQ